jgi:hypothetical protein
LGKGVADGWEVTGRFDLGEECGGPVVCHDDLVAEALDEGARVGG